MLALFTYKQFDPADYLDGIGDVATYLEIALEESAKDPTAVPRALGVMARSKNLSELARRVGMSRDGLYKALSEEGNPTWSTVLKLTTPWACVSRFTPWRDPAARPIRDRRTGDGTDLPRGCW